MASNKDLTAAINARAEALEIDVPETEGLTNADLVILKKELDARETPADAEAEAAAKAAAKADADATPPAVEAETPAPYSVAQGTSLTSLKGILGEGKAVTASDFTGGAETLDSLVERGLVVKA